MFIDQWYEYQADDRSVSDQSMLGTENFIDADSAIDKMC